MFLGLTNPSNTTQSSFITCKIDYEKKKKTNVINKKTPQKIDGVRHILAPTFPTAQRRRFSKTASQLYSYVTHSRG